MMVHPLPERSLSSSQCSIVALKSIKEAFNEDSIISQPKFRSNNRIKAIILRAMIQKYERVSKNKIRNTFLKWYCNSHPKLFKFSINRMMISGRISQGKVFYKLKIVAAQQDEEERKREFKGDCVKILKKDSNGLDQHKQIEEKIWDSLKKEKSFEKSQGKARKRDIKQLHQRLKQKNQLNCSILQDVSINKIEGDEENLFSTQQLENMKIVKLHNALRDSISLIDPKSGQIPVQLITCTNIFDNQSASINRMTSKLSGSLQIFRLVGKSRQSRIKGCFRRLIENMVQEDYEKLLIKAKRNLELAQQNFLIDTEMQNFLQNYQQQSNHLEKIDKHMQNLKQKFLYSRIISLLYVLKKVVYAPMRLLYDQFQSNILDSAMKKDKKVCYEISEIPAISSTSLSNKSSSFNYIPFYEKQSRIPRKSLEQRLQLKDFVTHGYNDYDNYSINSDDSEYSHK